MVALVRDRHDEEVAQRAGLSRTLRKPFDASEVAALLAGLAVQTRDLP